MANLTGQIKAVADYGTGIEDMVVNLTPEQSSTPSLMPETTSVYLRRATEGTGELMELVGGTVTWNQLVQNGNFVDSSIWNTYPGTQYVSDNVLTRIGTSDGTFTFTLSQPASFTAGHKVLIAVGFKCSSANQMRARYPFVSNAAAIPADTWVRFATIGEANASYLANVGVQCNSITNATCQYKNFICVDLTQMFGSAIADYVYSLEQATAGSGIQWLQSYGFFTEDYYACIFRPDLAERGSECACDERRE